LKIQTTRGRLLASTMICSAMALAMAAPAAAQDAAEVQEIVVTGSRIPQPNLTSTSPITVVGEEEVQLTGTTRVEDLVNQLPQAYAGQSSQVNNGSTGTATVDLRGLGVSRTLVLVDGKRLMPGDPTFPYPDLNAVPALMVERVEIVTGGASAVYGSDAIAGVVNFILKKDFEGVQLDAQYGFAIHKNDNEEARAALDDTEFDQPAENVLEGRTWDINLLMGANTPDGKGNATIYAGYRHVEPVLQSQYDYSACGIVTSGDEHICAGSSNYGRFISLDTGGDYFFGNGEVEEYDGSPAQSFNFAPTNYLQRPDERYILGGSAHYEITEALEVYTNVMFADDYSQSQSAASGLFIGSGPIDGGHLVNCDNPLLSADQVEALCTDAGLGPDDDALLFIGRRNVEGGNRPTDLQHTAYRINLGARGDLGNNWGYDLYGQYGTSRFASVYRGDLSKQRVQNALQVEDDGGTLRCAVDIAGIDVNCVPLDIFSGFGGITPEMLNYVGATGIQTGWTAEKVVSGTVHGEFPIQSPMASSPIGVAFGAEYRSEALLLDVSRDYQLDDLYGAGGATLPQPEAGFEVYELFGEARVPLIEDQPFFDLLQVELGYRWSDYSGSGSVDSYKLALDWAPVPDFRFRGSYQHAVRAPNVLELFTPNNDILYGGVDPCSGADPEYSLEQCEAQGVTPGQYGNIIDCPAGQCKQIVGGNAALRPEEADTYTFGLVATPSFLPGFTASVDYFDITVEKTIGGIGADTIVGICGDTLDPLYCNYIQRDPNGFLFTDNFGVLNTNQNLGYMKTSGVDFEASYRTSFADLGAGDLGGLSFHFVGSWLENFEIEPLPGATPYDCTGEFGGTCFNPYPEWRHRLRVTWTAPWDLSLSANWRYISEVNNDDDSEDLPDSTFEAYHYLDLAGIWRMSDNLSFRAGMNNVFDKDPPIINYQIDANINANTYPQTYDYLGRTIFIGLTAEF